jgi:tetratricopeptide (TPR) repeat protein
LREEKSWLEVWTKKKGYDEFSQRRAKILTAAFSFSLGDYAGADILLGEALHSCEEAGDWEGIANSLVWRTAVMHGTGSVEGTYTSAGLFFKLEQERGSFPPWMSIRVRLEHGFGIIGNYDFSAGLEIWNKGLALARRENDLWHIANFTSAFGQYYNWIADCEKAIPFLKEGIVLGNRLGDDTIVGSNYFLTAQSFLRIGDFHKSEEYFMKDIALSRSLGFYSFCAADLNGLGLVALNRRDYGEAKRLFDEAINLAREGGYAQGTGEYKISFGDLAFRKNDLDRAEYCYKDFLVFTQERPWVDRQNVVGILRRLAAVAAERGQSERAAYLLGAESAIRERHGFFVPLIERADLEKTLALLHSQIEDATFLRHWEEGRASEEEQAVACALER